MGLLHRLIPSSRNRIVSIVAILALGAVIDSRLPNGIFDRKNITNSAAGVGSTSLSDESALCVQTLFDFSSTMADNQEHFNYVALNTVNMNIPSCEKPAVNSEEALMAAHEECVTAILHDLDSKAREMGRLREQVFEQSPPICASNLPPNPMPPNEPYYQFPSDEKIDNTDFMMLEENLRRSHEQFLILTDAYYECIGEIARSVLQSTRKQGSPETHGGNNCKQAETATTIFNEHFGAVRGFINSLHDKSVPEPDTS